MEDGGNMPIFMWIIYLRLMSFISCFSVNKNALESTRLYFLPIIDIIIQLDSFFSRFYLIQI